MPFLRRQLLALALLAGLTVLALGQDPTKDSPYFPLKVGSRWTYRSGDNQFVMQVTKQEPIGKTVCARLDVLVAGKYLTSEHDAVQDDGVYRYTIAGEKYDPPLCILKLPPKKGVKWTYEAKFKGETTTGSTMLDEVEVKVPAGKYKAFRAESDYKVGDQAVNLTCWYAENVGLVKQVLKAGSAEIILELEKYEPGAK
jgi:hypothetical protein